MCSGFVFGDVWSSQKSSRVSPDHEECASHDDTKVGNLVGPKKKVTVSQLLRPRRCKRVQSALPTREEKGRGGSSLSAWFLCPHSDSQQLPVYLPPPPFLIMPWEGLRASFHAFVKNSLSFLGKEKSSHSLALYSVYIRPSWASAGQPRSGFLPRGRACQRMMSRYQPKLSQSVYSTASGLANNHDRKTTNRSDLHFERSDTAAWLEMLTVSCFFSFSFFFFISKFLLSFFFFFFFFEWEGKVRQKERQKKRKSGTINTQWHNWWRYERRQESPQTQAYTRTLFTPGWLQ